MRAEIECDQYNNTNKKTNTRVISEKSVFTNAICRKLFHIIEKSTTQLDVKGSHIIYLWQNKKLLYSSDSKIHLASFSYF